MSTNLRKKSFKRFKNPEKNHSWTDLGPRTARESSAKCLFEAAGFRVLDRHPSTKTTTAPWNLNGARSLGAPTHPLVTVFTKWPVIGGARRPDVWYKHRWYIWALLCRKQATKILDPSPTAKNRPFLQVLEKSVGRRGQLLARGSTWYLLGRLLLSPALPDTNWVGRGWLHVKIEGHRRVSCFDQRVDIFNMNFKAQVPPRTAAWTNNPRKTIYFSPGSP